mmetsp:Transcript_39079/g.59000  ORF Transcript_39079/g.59000 Transcript_39079/m.59000 type:complete len:149 (+) Transcript_39079:138-584(+)
MDSWADILAPRQKLMIKEKASVIEAVTAMMGQEIEMANKYEIKDKETGEQLFFAVETGSCCKRQCQTVCPDCAPFSLDVMLTHEGRNEKVFKMEKPWSVACCCFNRPKVTIYDVLADAEIGSVTQPWMLCNMKFEVLSVGLMSVEQLE